MLVFTVPDLSGAVFVQRTAICMRFTEAANVAHRSINRVLPQTKIVYNGQTYRGVHEFPGHNH